MNLLRIYSFLTILLVLLGCSANRAKPTVTHAKLKFPELIHQSQFGQRPQFITHDQLFELTPSQIKNFEIFSQKHRNRNRAPNRLVSDYLQSYLKDFNYYSETFSASDSLTNRRGNCLSLAILTKALAKLNNITVTYQLVETPPIYQKEGNIVLTSQHVRTKLSNPLEEDVMNNLLIRPSGVIIDYFSPRGSNVLRKVEESEFFGMYYRNKAAEAIIEKNYNRAYWLLKKTLSINIDDPHAINMMALIHYDFGKYKIAENLYLYGLQANTDKLDLLSNYKLLLQKLGRTDEAKEIGQKLAKIDNKNPFKWISLAHEAFKLENYLDALNYYIKAKRLAPYLHQSYAGIAQVKVQTGDIKSAKLNLEKALSLAHKADIKNIYQERLNQLDKG